MWSQLRHKTLLEFIVTARQLGFLYVELSHTVTSEMLQALPEEAASAVRALHHPCPNPGIVSSLSDPDNAARAAAVDQAKESIKWAARLGAQVVVMHLGIVGVDRRWENALRARWLQGEREEITFKMLGGYMEGLRAAQAARHFDSARRSLAQLLPFARKHGVQLGLENGEWLMSIPDLEEAARLLEEFDTTVGLWLDTGHATILEQLGYTSLLDWLHLAPDRILGLHYHDVNGLRDHLIPGKGTIDWRALVPHIPSHALPTCEFDWYYTPEEVAAGTERLAIHGLVEWSK
ncbi:MAG: sugar phosphate isomerase/epimerase [Chloroflexota bacterium]|nr:sugar phosphate isomerase/epimerase [Chloroflexota bacterium]